MGKKSKIRNEYNELRQLFKDMQKRKKKYDDSEDRFEDDPRAVKEVEYGRVIRKFYFISCCENERVFPSHFSSSFSSTRSQAGHL